MSWANQKSSVKQQWCDDGYRRPLGPLRSNVICIHTLYSMYQHILSPQFSHYIIYKVSMYYVLSGLKKNLLRKAISFILAGASIFCNCLVGKESLLVLLLGTVYLSDFLYNTDLNHQSLPKK